MSLPFDMVANIKTHNSSEEEIKDEASNEHDVLEILEGFPEVTEENLATTKTEEDEPNAEETEMAEDPLEDKKQETTNKYPFQWEFEEADYLCTVGNEDNYSDDGHLTKAGSKSKRARLSNEVKGQNGQVWSTNRVSSVEGTAASEGLLLTSFQSKGKGPAQNASNPLEVWFLLLDEPILIQVVQYTNEEIRQRKGRASHQRTTDLIELRAWLGLNYLCGIFRNAEHNGPWEELWTVELGNLIFRVTMSLKRFQFLAECVSFCDRVSKQKSLPAVSQMWERFNTNCRSYYAPSEHCAIDELILETAAASCPFQNHLPDDDTKKGLRIVGMWDAKTLYMCNTFLTTNANPRDQDVLQLVCDIKGTQRTVSLNKRYTSLSLTNKILIYQLNAVGALAATAAEVPRDLSSSASWQRLYASSATLIAGLQLDESPTGLLLSNGISRTTDAVKLYQCTSPCSQRFQQLTSNYSCRLATPPTVNRWPLHIMHAMLDYAAFNAWILMRLSANGDGSLSQRDFLRQLGMYLTQQHLKRRLQYNNKLTIMQKLQLCEILGEPTERLLSDAAAAASTKVGSGTMPLAHSHIPDGIKLASRYMANRRRCRKCTSKSGSKTRLRCQQCLTPLCGKHMIFRCTVCTGVPEEADNKSNT